MRRTIYPGYTTTGVVVENDSMEPEYVDRVKVRIYELHGASSDYSPTDTTISDDFTPDEDLPWIKVIMPTGFTMASKVLVYPVDGLVYVQFPSGNPEDGLVIGKAMADSDAALSDIAKYYKSLIQGGLSGNNQYPTGTPSYLDLHNVGNNSLFYNPIIDAAGHALPGLYVSSGYGMRTLDGKPNFHTGVDLTGVGSDVPVYASRDGVVVEGTCSDYPPNTFVSGSYGNQVLIYHGMFVGLDGVNHEFYTRYAHLNRVNVSINDRVEGVCPSVSGVVKRAQTIGLLGNTGHSYGAHLHFEILIDGTVPRASYSGPAVNAANPMNYISID